MKLLLDPPEVLEGACCLGSGESGLAEGVLDVPAPAACCAAASAGRSSRTSHNAKEFDKKNRMRMARGLSMSSPRISAAECVATTDPGPMVLPGPPRCPNNRQSCAFGDAS